MTTETPEQAAPVLRTVQSLWAMEDLPRGAPEWSLEEQIEKLEGAGYDTVAVDLGARKAPSAERLAAALEQSPLESMVFTFAGTDEALAQSLEFAQVIDAKEMVLCASFYEQDIHLAALQITRWFEQAEKEGVALQLETHRNTVTNDLRFTRRLVEVLDPRIELAIDLSHYIVGAEIPDTPSPEVEDQVAGIIARAGSVQGRIASRSQVQLPLEHPLAAPWVALSRRWWRQAFQSILERRDFADRSAPVTFVTELGTTPYALVGMDGVELADRWADALQLVEWASEELAAVHSQLAPIPIGRPFHSAQALSAPLTRRDGHGNH